MKFWNTRDRKQGKILRDKLPFPRKVMSMKHLAFLLGHFCFLLGCETNVTKAIKEIQSASTRDGAEEGNATRLQEIHNPGGHWEAALSSSLTCACLLSTCAHPALYTGLFFLFCFQFANIK